MWKLYRQLLPRACTYVVEVHFVSRYSVHIIVIAGRLAHRVVPHPHVTNRVGVGEWGGGIMLAMPFINFTRRYTIAKSNIIRSISMVGGGEAHSTPFGDNG